MQRESDLAVDTIANDNDRDVAPRGQARLDLIADLASRLPSFEASWKRGRAFAVAERALAHAERYGDLHEAVLAAMSPPPSEEHPLAVLAFQRGCYLDTERWPDAWLDICEFGGVSEAVALEAIGEVPDHFRRSRRRRNEARSRHVVDALETRDIQRLAPKPSAGVVIEQLIIGELVVDYE